MTEEEKDAQVTPPEEAQTEPSIEESVPEPEVVESVPETVVPVASEVISEPVETAPESQTAQFRPFEPLPERQNESAEATAEAQEEPTPTPTKEEREPRKQDEPNQEEKLGLLRKMARATIQLRREKKLGKIMALFAKQTAVTNDEVEKLLHVSDATATRYLSLLEKRGKLKQVGTTGRGVSYIKCEQS